MANLLIVTFGFTDLQVAATVDGRSVRVDFEDATRRRCLDALSSGRWAISEDETKFERREGKRRLAALAADGCITVEGGTVCKDGDRHVLIPAKLAGLPREVREKGTPTAVIVFGTRRDKDDREPVAAADILAQWFGAEFGLESRSADPSLPARAKVVHFLTGAERSEGPEGVGVNPLAIDRIEVTLKALGGSCENVYLAVEGGLPAYREEIRAIARYRFPAAKLWTWRKPGDQPGSLTEAKATILPSQSFRARYEARRLVREGDFSGAWSLSRQLEDIDREQRWIGPLREMADFLDGDLKSPKLASVKRLSSSGLPLCLHAAFRVEAALLSGRYVEAIIWTYNFWDLAVKDGIRKCDFVERVRTKNFVFIRRDAEIDRRLLADDFSRNRPCLSQHEDAAKDQSLEFVYFFGTEKRNIDIWIDYFKSKFFEDMVGAIRENTKFRNAIIHSSVKANDVAKARKVFRDLGIWSSSDAELQFLEQPTIVGILRYVGLEDSAADLFRAVRDDLLDRMDAHTFASG